MSSLINVKSPKYPCDIPIIVSHEYSIGNTISVGYVPAPEVIRWGIPGMTGVGKSLLKYGDARIGSFQIFHSYSDIP